MILDSVGIATRKRPAVTSVSPGLRQRLEAARLYALAGQTESARSACAALMLDDLATFASDRRLVRPLIEVLLLCGGLRQIGRLLRAIDGCAVEFLPGTGAANSGEPFLLHADDAVLTIMLDISEMQRPRAASLARTWSERILRASNPGFAQATAATSWPAGGR